MNTVVLIKPDAFERMLVGYIISSIESNFIIHQAKIVYMEGFFIAQHYCHHVAKDYYLDLSTFMQSGPTLALQIGGDPVAVTELRNKLRESLGIENPRNLIHSSDLKNVVYELDLWFPGL